MRSTGIIDLPQKLNGCAMDLARKKTSRFKHYLRAKEILMIPVAHDPLCATIIERAGFRVVGCGGYANSAALLSAPDIELLTYRDGRRRVADS